MINQSEIKYTIIADPIINAAKASNLVSKIIESATKQTIMKTNDKMVSKFFIKNAYKSETAFIEYKGLLFVLNLSSVFIFSAKFDVSLIFLKSIALELPKEVKCKVIVLKILSIIFLEIVKDVILSILNLYFWFCKNL